MTRRMLVRGETSAWLHAGRVFAFLAMVVGVLVVWLQGLESPLGAILAALGGAAWLVLEAVALNARWVRSYLTDGGDCFLYETRGQAREVQDEHVTAIALESKRNLSNGEVASITRTVRLWAEGKAGPLILQNRIKVGAPDPLLEFINRQIAAVQSRLETELDRGGDVQGDGWRLSRSALTLGRAPSEQMLPLTELTAVEEFDGAVCVWRQGKDEAAAKLPLAGANAFLLPQLVQRLLPERADTGGAESASGLGRVLFQRGASATLTWLLLGLGLFFALVGVPVLLADDKDSLVIGALMVVGGSGAIVGGLALRFTMFRCHERGVYKKTLLGERTLRYADVESFTYGATRHYHNGAYTGTNLSLSFQPRAGSGQPAIRFSTMVQGLDDALDNLRDFISRVLAARMAERIQQGQPIAWTPSLELHPNGVRYVPAGFFGKKEAVFLPFEKYGGHSLHEGHFHLFERGKDQSVFNEPCSAENFFPGYFLLCLMEQAGEEDEET